MKIRLAGLLFAVIVTSSSIHAAIIIDDYSAGDPMAQFGAGTTPDSTNDPGSILGDTRDASITVRDLGGVEDHGTLTFTDDVSIGQGSEDQIKGALTYDGFSNYDMSQGGANTRFLLTVVSSDSAVPLTEVVSLTVVSGGNVDKEFITIPSAAELAGGPKSVYLDFDAFETVDFESLDSIILAFDFENHPGRDVKLAIFGATSSVPEPSGGVLLSVMGLLALLRHRRRS